MILLLEFGINKDILISNSCLLRIIIQIMSKVIIVLVQSNYPAFYPKYTHYMSDGEGRDTYILKHNGGLWNEAERPIAQSRFYPKEKVRVVIPAPRKDAVSFKYISDGSGRDFYITHNSGGLQAPYIPGSVKASATFFTSLRKIEKRNKLIRFASPKEIERMKTSLISQRKLIARLTSSSSDWRKINKELRKSFIKDKWEKFSHKRDNSYDYGKFNNLNISFKFDLFIRILFWCKENVP